MALPGSRDRPIRLTYVITDLELGGVPLHLHRLATRLPRDRFDPCVISLARMGPVGEMLLSDGIEVSACGARRASDLRALGRLWRLLRLRPPRILHSFLFHANTACRVIGPLAGVPLGRIICEIQTAEIERRWHLVVDNLTCRLCRFEIGNSPSVVAHLCRYAHLPASRVRCEWGAVDVAAIESAEPASRGAFGLPEDEPVVIWTGRLDPVKGFEEMLAAFADVCRSRPAWLVLVGDGPYRPTVEGLIRTHGLQARVKMLGRRTDVPRLLKMADAFLFCSRTEGLPNALLEAMAAGLPVVTTDAPGCRDVVIDGRTGLVAPAGEAGALSGKLSRLLLDRGEMRRLGQQGQGFVCDYLNAAGLAVRWGRLYDGIA